MLVDSCSVHSQALRGIYSRPAPSSSHPHAALWPCSLYRRLDIPGHMAAITPALVVRGAAMSGGLPLAEGPIHSLTVWAEDEPLPSASTRASSIAAGVRVEGCGTYPES